MFNLISTTRGTARSSLRSFSVSRPAGQTLFVTPFDKDQAHTQIADILAHRPSIKVQTTDILSTTKDDQPRESAVITFKADSEEMAQDLKSAFEKNQKRCLMTRDNHEEMANAQGQALDPYSYQVVNLPPTLTTSSDLASTFLPARGIHGSRIATFELGPPGSQTGYIHIGKDIDTVDFKFFIERTKLWLEKGPATAQHTLRILRRETTSDAIKAKKAELAATKGTYEQTFDPSVPLKNNAKIPGSAILPIRMEIERQVVGRWGERLPSLLFPSR